MSGKFLFQRFKDINLQDPFFDSLKRDYPEFATTWFPKCIAEHRIALVFYDATGLGAFIAFKNENEPIPLQGKILPACSRLKISTLRIAERFRGQRLGEGAIGLLLWMWRKQGDSEIYISVFPEHQDLIMQLTKFGFINQGINKRGENIYLRSRANINYSSPYSSFPFISPWFTKGGYLIIQDNYHDTLFPYSELQNTLQEPLDIDAANGITKIYIGQQWSTHYAPGEPVFIYRKYTGKNGQPRYKSCLTSYTSIIDVTAVKRSRRCLMTYEDYLKLIGNKSVYTQQDLQFQYSHFNNLTVIRLLYCGFFGEGKNISMDWLDNSHLWTSGQYQYPADIQLSPAQCASIWKKGNMSFKDVFGRLN